MCTFAVMREVTRRTVLLTAVRKIVDSKRLNVFVKMTWKSSDFAYIRTFSMSIGRDDIGYLVDVVLRTEVVSY